MTDHQNPWCKRQDVKLQDIIGVFTGFYGLFIGLLKKTIKKLINKNNAMHTQ